MKHTHVIIAICAALGGFAAGRFSQQHTPQQKSHAAYSPSAAATSLPTQSAIIQKGNDTLRVEGAASLVPLQPSSTSIPHP